MDYLGYQSMKKRNVHEKSYAVNESCSISWQDWTRPLPNFCIVPAAFTDFKNAYRNMPPLSIDIVSAVRPTQSAEINS